MAITNFERHSAHPVQHRRRRLVVDGKGQRQHRWGFYNLLSHAHCVLCNDVSSKSARHALKCFSVVYTSDFETDCYCCSHFIARDIDNKIPNMPLSNLTESEVNIELLHIK